MAYDQAGFLTTLGREFALVLDSVVEEPTPQDCFSVISEYLNDGFTVEHLEVLDDGDFKKIAKLFCAYFEVTDVTAQQIKVATKKTISHWS